MRYRFEDLEIDLSTQAVQRGTEKIEVKGLSFQLLAFLLAQGSRVVGFDELITAVWAPAVVNEETVTQRVRLLRAALGDDGRKPRYIRSIRGQGYQLCNNPQVLEATSPRTAPFKRLSAPIAIAAAVVLVLAAVSALTFVTKDAPHIVTDETKRLLQRARYYADIGQADNNERAISMYEQVLETDPDNTSALLGLSFGLSARMCLFNGPPFAAERAEALARRVLARKASNARAHAALGYSMDCRGFIDSALEAYERAVALDPAGRRDSVASAAHLYAVKGRLADALRMNLAVWPTHDELRFVGLQVARSLELLGFQAAAEQRYAEEFRLYPDNVFASIAYPLHLFTQGRLTEAEAVVAAAMQRPIRPELLILAGELHLLGGRREAAHDSFEQAAALRAHLSLPHSLAGIYAESKPGPDWFQARVQSLQSAIARGDLWPKNWLELALLEWHRDREEAAITALNTAVDHGYRDIAYLRASPLFNDIRRNRGFAEVLDRISRAVADERDKVLAAGWLPAESMPAEASTRR